MNKALQDSEQNYGYDGKGDPYDFGGRELYREILMVQRKLDFKRDMSVRKTWGGSQLVEQSNNTHEQEQERSYFNVIKSLRFSPFSGKTGMR